MSPVMSTTTTLPVTVVYAMASPITMLQWLPLMGLSSIRSAQCGSATTIDPMEHSEGFSWPCQCATAATIPVHDAFSGICKLCHGSSSDDFSPLELILPQINFTIFWCLLWCLLSAFRFPCGTPCLPMGDQLFEFAVSQPFGVHPWQVYVTPGVGV